MNITEAEGIYRRIADNIETVIRGKTPVIRKVVAALISCRHVLLDALPLNKASAS